MSPDRVAEQDRHATVWGGGAIDALGYTTLTTWYSDGTKEAVRFKPTQRGALVIIPRRGV